MPDTAPSPSPSPSLAALGDRGERPLPAVVDAIARETPDRILFSMAEPSTGGGSGGGGLHFRDLSARAFARAVDRCAWHLDRGLGGSVWDQASPTTTLLYMGPQDVNYAVVVLACAKTGRRALLSSPRNTLAAHLALLDDTGCRCLLRPTTADSHSPLPPPAVGRILAARGDMRVLDMPGWRHWFDDDGREKEEGEEGEEKEEEEPYPYTRTFAQAKSDPFAVLHTSGSTGLPKPIVQTMGTIAALDAFAGLASLGQSGPGHEHENEHEHDDEYDTEPTVLEMFRGARVYLTFPLFHTAGLQVLLPGAVYSGYTVVLCPSPPSADAADAVHVHGDVQFSCMAPFTLVELSHDPRKLENLARLRHITFGGGPLPQAVGDLVSTRTRLFNALGTTEVGTLPTQMCDAEDWAYLRYSRVLGCEFRHVAEDLYEQVIVRDDRLRRYQGVFHTFPELDEYPMKDLYSKHPTKPDTWLYRGRLDDVVVFSNGEKLNPLEMEDLIGGDPNVGAALVSGLGRFQANLLVEPARAPASDAEREALLDALWPSVQAANQLCPTHGRIHRNMIALTVPEKPMLRAGKGTVQRQLTLDLYADEIDALYRAVDWPSAATSGTAIDNNDDDDGDDADTTVRKILAACTDIDAATLDADADLFAAGLDSLQVSLITRQVNSRLRRRRRAPAMQPRLVYARPSVRGLAAVVAGLVAGRDPLLLTGSGGAAADEVKEQERERLPEEKKLQRLFDRFAADLPLNARAPQPGRSDGRAVVLLTGATGSVGSYVLYALARDPRVAKIYCLNRVSSSSLSSSNSSAEEQTSSCLATTDLAAPYLGLGTDGDAVVLYEALLREVTVVIHGAWRVDFNLSVDSFAGQVAGVRRLVDFCAGSRRGAGLFFVSSVGAVTGYQDRSAPADDEAVRADGLAAVAPARIFADWRTPGGETYTGYGGSKFVAERLLDAAAALPGGVRTTVCRVGQVAGPTTQAGEWPRQEWLPSLVASSAQLGKLPADLGRLAAVDWIPVDVLSQCIVELALRPAEDGAPDGRAPGAAVYHLANPRRTSWEAVVPVVARCLARAGKTIELVSLDEWLAALRESAAAAGADDLTRNPAMKLLDFYESLAAGGAEMVMLDTKDTVAASETLSSVEAVHDEWVENWMRQWGF
ncbi:hypothetical protein GGR56DRAFT_666669 [Xylariaceae sp. FL0804]|nr:hypothetical protein GGR56DRAFT_666669 [Xylariaceae sp. FL0804]